VESEPFKNFITLKARKKSSGAREMGKPMGLAMTRHLANLSLSLSLSLSLIRIQGFLINKFFYFFISII
jgi:hypothetical protein